MQVQTGTKFLPILLTPRIKGKAVKVSDIKSTYSGKFISDALTPLKFFLEREERGQAPVSIEWDSVTSTDDKIYFSVPDSVYATEKTYTIIFYWTVSDLIPTVLEKIFTENSITLEVLDLHKNPG